MPSISRTSRWKDANGTGVSSHGVAASATVGVETVRGVWCACRGRFVRRCGRAAGRPGERWWVVLGFKLLWLTRAESNDAPNGIVRRDADGHPIARNHFDTEAAHSAAELGQHLV